MIYFREVVMRIIEEDACLLLMHSLIAHQELTVLAIFELSCLLRAESFSILFIKVAKLELLKGHPIVIYVHFPLDSLTISVECLLCRVHSQEKVR